MAFKMESNNPVLTDQDVFNEVYGKDMFIERPTTTTMAGVVNRTLILVLIALTTGGFGYWIIGPNTTVMLVSMLAALGLCLGAGFMLKGKPQLAPVIAIPFAAVEGLFLGCLTIAVEWMLARGGYAVAGGVALQAFIITGSLMLTMLFLYRARIIRPTARFSAVVTTLTVGIMVTYLATFVVSMFGVSMPLVSFGAAFQETGMMGLLGLGVNLLFLLVASLGLILDFEQAENCVAEGAPKYMEWYCAFGLLVSLAWIYYEALKLVVRLAVLFGGRE